MFNFKNKDKNIKAINLISLSVIIIFSLILYGIMTKNYVDRYICNVRGSFFRISILYWLVISFLTKRIFTSPFCKIKAAWGKVLYFLLIPIAALYIEELIWNTSITELNVQNWVLNYIAGGRAFFYCIKSYNNIFRYTVILLDLWNG